MTLDAKALEAACLAYRRRFPLFDEERANVTAAPVDPWLTNYMTSAIQAYLDAADLVERSALQEMIVERDVLLDELTAARQGHDKVEDERDEARRKTRTRFLELNDWARIAKRNVDECDRIRVELEGTADDRDGWQRIAVKRANERDEALSLAETQGRQLAALREALKHLIDECDEVIEEDYLPHSLPLAQARAALTDTAAAAAQWVRIPTLEAIARGIYANEAGSMKLDDDAFDDLEEADKLLYFVRAKGAHNALLAAAPNLSSVAEGEAGEPEGE